MKIILSAGVVAYYFIGNALLNLYYSPITSKLTANTFNDSVTDYTFARFVQNGGISMIITLSSLFFLAIIWGRTISNSLSVKQTQN